MKKFINIALVISFFFIIFVPNIAFADYSQVITNKLYQLKLPSGYDLLSTNSNNYTSVLCDEKINFTSKISFESISKDDLDAVREYIGDYDTSTKDLYDKIIDLKLASYTAVEKSYQNSTLFYPLNKEYSEYDFKIIDMQKQEFFGVNTSTIIYNTLNASLDNISEYCNIEMYIPSYENNGIYNISFTLNRNNMNLENIIKLSEIFKNLSLNGHKSEDRIPLIFLTNSNIQKAVSGIYPAFTFKNYNLKPYNKKEMGLSFLYPDFIVPTGELTNFSGMQYASFKIDPFTNFNVSVADTASYPIQNAITTTLANSGDNVTVSKINTYESPNGNIIEIVLDYTENDIKYNNYSYYLANNGNTVVYSFVTSMQASNYKLEDIAARVLMTTKIYGKTPSSSHATLSNTHTFGESTFKLPKNFVVKTTKENYLKITSPDVDTFKIYVFCEQLKNEPDNDTSAKIANSDLNAYSNLFNTRFLPPYNAIQNAYLGGNFLLTDDGIKLNRLSKYLDENERVHYCYTISFSKGKKLYSMMIDINTALLREDGKVGSTLPSIFNEIARSFSLAK